MSKSNTVDVYVKLPYGLAIGYDGADSTRLLLEHGLNENVPRSRIETWMQQNKNLAAVKNGNVRIISDDVLAYDSGK